MPKRLYILTVGCQMNVLDSELVTADLLQAGYRLADDPHQADVILFNTCSVRQHAEDKIYSALGRLKELKQRRPGTIIGVLGCMAQKDQQQILKRAPHVDVVVGPGQLWQLPDLLEDVAAGKGPQLEVSLDRRDADRASVRESFARFDPLRTAEARGVPQQALVRIMFGCDMLCTYCIVPRVRGPEQSRPAGEIVEEVRRLCDEGCLEVTLLGQTVNSYRDRSSGATVRLADLLYRLHDTPGLRRLRFLTNHPRHMSPELIAAMRDLPKISPYLHVPAQSGSNRMLERMKRPYTVEFYRDMLAEIRAVVPAVAITSDFIVGFCGETDEDFEQTARLVSDARFKNSFIFKYSARTGTPAAELYADDVPEEVKRRRNNDLLAIQNAICLEDNQPFVGRKVEILCEGPSKVARRRIKAAQASRRQDSGGGVLPLLDDEVARAGARQHLQLTGRTVCDRIVVFEGPPSLTGKMFDVEIEKVDGFTLFGRPVEDVASHGGRSSAILVSEAAPAG